ncbi:MAG: HD-GYP domain-containing protein [Veillonellales bacterium]
MFSKIKIIASLQTMPEIVSSFLSLIADYDRYTAEHSFKVQRLAMELAAGLDLAAPIIQDISDAALLHDIGKMKISNTILTKPGKLTHSEFEIIKRHPEYGYQILNGSRQLHHIAKIVLHHHEKFNGTGYPSGSSGEGIPLISRILTLADVYEAITSDRCYRKAMSPQESLKVIREGSGTWFDPVLVDVFFRNKPP